MRLKSMSIIRGSKIRFRKIDTVWVCVIFSLCTFDGYAQSFHLSSYQNLISKSTGFTSAQNLPGSMSVSVVKGNNILSTKTLDMNEDVNAIVQFKHDPLRQRSGLMKKVSPSMLSIGAAQITSEHARFHSDVQQLENQPSSRSRGLFAAAHTRFRFEYAEAINGIAVTTKRWLLEEIRNLPYIQNVSEDGIVHAFDDASNAVVHADSFWTDYDVKGDSIVIGIIDTGIDYFHEALGSAAFPNSKVIGGYDFVNNDPDPMDDNGHGTHVAGIAAGDGPPPTSLRGVAPKAKIMAFKVLDADGVGSFSQVIAGIERALDPDGDPLTEDAVDVINLSLGGEGGPNSMVAQAVNNAVAAGIVCIVAAGNSGPGYMTIASPGNAADGVCVGAADNTNAIAYFSSRGPSTELFDIKPDVVAPGVDINSAKNGGGYIRHSGTSMASPHVAGVAALLRQLHRSWTPGQIKALIMESAHDDGYDVWTQGSGMVDLSRAGAMQSVITPPCLNFGLDNLNETNWITTNTLTLHNFSSDAKEFTLSTEGLPNGVTLTFQPASVTVPSGNDVQIVVTMNVDNTILTFPSAVPSYAGKIIAQSSSEDEPINVPVVFAKAPHLSLHFDTVPWIVIVHNNTDQFFMNAFPGNDLSLYPPAGTYDILVRYTGAARQIIRENVSVNGEVSLDIHKSEAQNQVYFSTLDAASSPIPFDNFGLTWLVNKNSGFGITTAGTISDSSDWSKIYFSDFSSQYVYELKTSAYSAASHHDYYEFPFRLDQGVHNSIIVQNDPSEFKRVAWTYTHPKSATTLCFIPYFYRPSSPSANGYRYNTDFPFASSPYTLQTPFTLTAYFLPGIDDNFAVNYAYQDVYDISQSPNFLYSTAMTTVVLPDTFFVGRAEDPMFSSNAASFAFELNGAPPRWNGKISSANSSSVIVSPLPSSNVGLFLSPSGDVTSANVKYVLYTNGILAYSDSITNAISCDEPMHVSLAPGENELRFSYDSYVINGRQGHALAKLGFTMPATALNLPSIKKLQISSNGEITNSLQSSANNRISISLTGDALASVHCYMRLIADTVWSELAQDPSSGESDFPLPENLPGGLYSLRITSSDGNGSTLDYSLEPGFNISKLEVHPSAALFDSVSVGNFSTDSVTLISSGMMCGDTIEVSSNNPAFTVFPEKICVEDKDSLRIHITYRPRVRGTETGEIIFSSINPALVESIQVVGVGFVLLPPVQFLRVFSDSSSYTLRWEKDSVASSYWVQISTDSVFNTIVGNYSAVTDTFEVLENLRDSLSYFCRIKKQNIVSSSGWSQALKFIAMRAEFIVQVYQGWNLLSLPLGGIENAAPKTLFPSATSDAFIFNGKYVPSSDVQTGRGYWLKFERDQSIKISGLSSDQLTVDVSKGWNLIGALLHPVASASVLPINTNIVSQFYGFSADYFAAETLHAGQAYWVKVDAPGKLQMDPMAHSSRVSFGKNPLSRFNSITFEDESGRRRTVYYDDGSDTLIRPELFELPPPAPEHSFDVRFASGSSFASFGGSQSGEMSIDVSPGEGQLKVTWKSYDNDYVPVLKFGGQEISMSSEGSTEIPSPQSKIMLKLVSRLSMPVPKQFVLEQNFPNPFNPATKIKYDLPEETHVRIRIFNELGQEVRTLVDEVQRSGYRSVDFDANLLPSGVYFYRIQTEKFSDVKKMLLMK